MYTPNSGSKPRFDGKGTEFGLLHRELPKHICMFDIDGMKAIFKQSLIARKQNEAFLEYRHIEEEIIFTAFLELKYKYTKKALDMSESVNRARLEMVQRISYGQNIPCRLFIVFENNGRQPYDFWEIDLNGNPEYVGRLEFDQYNKEERINNFWRDLELLEI